MHVSFINPPNNPFSSSGILIEPIDTISLATWVQSYGYEVSFVDMDVNKMQASELSKEYKKWPAVIVIIYDYHIPLHNSGTVQQIELISKEAHQNNSFVVLGGKAASFYSDLEIQKFGVDACIAFEMEEPILNLLETLESKSLPFTEKNLDQLVNTRLILKDKVLSSKKQKLKIDINKLPIPDRTLIDMSSYIDVRTILSSQGCNLKCSFCHVPGFWGVWNGRSASNVVEEIEYLKTNFDSKKILFLDDNALAQSSRMSDIALKVKEKNLDVSLGCLGTILSFKEKVLQDMFKGGFRWIHYGAESGDDEQLQKMGKRITSQKIYEVVKKTKEIGYRVRTSWILDMPDLTHDALKRTEDLILNHHADEIRLHFLTLRLGSILHDQYKIETPQFIHHSTQNLNISSLPEELIQDSLKRILEGLVSKGFVVVRNPDDFIDLNLLRQKSPDLKIVSLCPLRYGINWR